MSFEDEELQKLRGLPHPNVGDEENEAMMESALSGGAWLDKLGVGRKLEVTTESRKYIIERRKDGLYISGHPKYCPEPTRLEIHGSKFGQRGSMLKVGFVGRGMFLEFENKNKGKDLEHPPVVTSRIQEVRELPEE